MAVAISNNINQALASQYLGIRIPGQVILVGLVGMGKKETMTFYFFK